MRLNDLIDRRTRIQLAGLFGLMLVTAALELMGIGFVFVLLQAITTNDTEFLHPVLHRVLSGLGSLQEPKTLAFLGVGVVVLYTFKNVVLGLILYGQFRFTGKKQAEFQDLLYARYLGRDHLFMMSINSADLIRNVTSSLTRVFGSGLQAVLGIMMEVIVCFVILVVLFRIEPAATLVNVVFFGITMSVYNLLSRKRLSKIGHAAETAYAKMLLWIGQGISSHRELTISGRQSFFAARFRSQAHDLALLIAKSSMANRLPSLINEVILIVGVGAAITVIYIDNPDFLLGGVPSLGAFALAGLRLYPSVSRISSGLSMLHISAAAVDNIYDDLQVSDSAPVRHAPAPLSTSPFIAREIRVDGVSFQYPGASEPVLSDISFTLGKGESVALVGLSGSGKTTLIDIMLGLLRPVAGTVTVDGSDIHQNTDRWWPSVGLVSQNICLLDDTLTRNIAFGIPDDQIDPDKLKWAIGLACLQDVQSSLVNNGTDRSIGENGARLSGGERQRIGIARALYVDPELLVLDEATSALDSRVESEISRNLRDLQGQTTQLIIAHRMSSIRYCTRIIFLRHGRIKAQGTFDELRQNDADFRTLVELSQLETGDVT